MSNNLKQNKILIATPMLPPSLGGPAIHTVKLFEYFGGELFCFEKLNKYPAGIRHLIAFIQIFRKSIGKEIIFALDGFSVALPAVIVGKILNKKVFLRIGGDLVHEQFVETYPIDMGKFYRGLESNKFVLNIKLNVKLKIQKFVNRHAYGIIFTTNWQKEIYSKYYKLTKHIYVIENPIDNEIATTNSKFRNDEYKHSTIKTILSATRDVAFKNLNALKDAVRQAQIQIDKINDVNIYESEDGKEKSISELNSRKQKETETILLDLERSDKLNLLLRIKKARAYACVSYSDISPNTVLDALALGTPVILTKNTGFYDELLSQNVCRFVDPYNVDDIKQAILEMCDEKIYRQYKENLKNFKWKQTWKSLLEQYEEIVKLS